MKIIFTAAGIRNTAIVVFNHGAFGGAPKRFTNLFFYLQRHHPENFHFIINAHLFTQLKEIFGEDFIRDNVHVIDSEGDKTRTTIDSAHSRYYADHVTDPLEIDKSIFLPRKFYQYYKNLLRQKKLFSKVEKIRSKFDIRVFDGVFGGVMPLVFYTKESPRRAAVIFSDMDSWFTDVLSDTGKLWYRKYHSFNDALKNADVVDFLSPYILEGVRNRGVKIEDERAIVAPGSFADYTKCTAGSKTKFEIAFASRLEPDKNPMMFLEAAKIIHEDHPEVKFHILGEGTLVREIDNYIKKNELSDVINFRFHKNPPEVFVSTSVFVSLQSATNYPSQSVLEAMACRNAIVASNKGDTGLLVNESNGILIALDRGSLVSALKELIQNPARTRALGEAGREFVLRNHTIEKAAAYYLGLYDKAYNRVFGGKD